MLRNDVRGDAEEPHPPGPKRRVEAVTIPEGTREHFRCQIVGEVRTDATREVTVDRNEMVGDEGVR
jgi:hypothetical protein